MSPLTVELTDVMKKCLILPCYESHWDVVSISCVEKHCLITFEDTVIFCLEVPLSEVDTIQCDDFNNYDTFVILHSLSQGGCVLSLKEKKVLEYFDTVKEIFVDDYVNIGHEQLIFVFNNSDEDEDEDFYVTDYDCCFFDTRSGKHCSSLKPDEHATEHDKQCDGYNSALSSLKKKILSTTTQLHDEIAKKIEKEELAMRTIERLVYQSLDEEYHFVDPPGLLNLFGEDNYSTIDEKRLDEANPFIVHDIWFKIHHEQIVIVTEIENRSKDCLYNLSLHLLSSGVDISCSSEMIFFNNKIGMKQSAIKQQKLDTHILEKNSMYPSRRCNLTSSTSYPLSVSPFVEFELVINYCKENDKRYSVFVGKKKIMTADLISDSSMVAENFSDRDAKSNIAFDFVNYKKTFTLTSETSSLLSLPKAISTRLNCKSNAFQNMFVLKPMYLNAEMRFLSSPSSLDCFVYGKERKVLEMVVSEIDKVLPADVERRMKFDLLKVLLKQFYDFLKKEIDASISYYENSLLMIEEENERDKLVIVIDSPKRKRNVNTSKNEVLYNEYIESVLNTDEFLIANVDHLNS